MGKVIIFVLFILSIIVIYSCAKKKKVDKIIEVTKINDTPLTYKLPDINTIGNVSLEEVLNKRRSRRHFINRKVSIQNISQILWAAYGITQLAPDEPYIYGGYRTTPSAGVVYPLKIYLLAGNVKDIESGIYKFDPIERTIIRVVNSDVRTDLAVAAINQEMIQKAPASIIICAVSEKMIKRYGERGLNRFIPMEAGHASQNIYLQVEALHMGTCTVGAFIDDDVKKVMELPENENPLYIMPVGYYFRNFMK